MFEKVWLRKNILQWTKWEKVKLRGSKPNNNTYLKTILGRKLKKKKIPIEYSMDNNFLY